MFSKPPVEQTGYGHAVKITLSGRRDRAIVTDVTSRVGQQFGLRDTVRLLNQHDAIPAGAVGSVIGWFVGEETYVVNFVDDCARVAEVYSDEIVLTKLH